MIVSSFFFQFFFLLFYLKNYETNITLYIFLSIYKKSHLSRNLFHAFKKTNWRRNWFTNQICDGVALQLDKITREKKKKIWRKLFFLFSLRQFSPSNGFKQNLNGETVIGRSIWMSIRFFFLYIFIHLCLHIHLS